MMMVNDDHSGPVERKSIRKITGKKVTDEIEGKIHFIGILLLFALMIYVTWNDIMKFIIPIFS